MRISDWSSDVCSSDVLLGGLHEVLQGLRGGLVLPAGQQQAAGRGARNGSSLAEKNAALQGCSPGCRVRSGRFRQHPSIADRWPLSLNRKLPKMEIGRAPCRERVRQYV